MGLAFSLYSFSDKQGTTGSQFNRFNVRAPFSDLAVFGSDGLAACGEVEEGVVAEEVGCFLLKQLADGDGQAADLNVGRRVAAHLDEMAQGPGVGRDQDLGLGGMGQDATRRLAGFLAPEGPVGDVLECFREAVGEVAIGDLAGLDRLEPDPVQLGVSGDDLGFDERAFRLIDETEHHGAVRQPLAHRGGGRSAH